jgi:transformation/transcription domain-associated protein
MEEDSVDDAYYSNVLESQRGFLESLMTEKLEVMISSLRGFVHEDPRLVYSLWVSVFPFFWSALEGNERHDVVKDMISLAAHDYHAVQADMRPNVIQAMLEGACKCNPVLPLPPHLVRYLGETYNAWHIALELLHKSQSEISQSIVVSTKEDDKIRDAIMDATASLYEQLSEQDYFAGLWRRRCMFQETNAAVSFEQNSVWSVAQSYYEQAQAKARTGVLPFLEVEYVLWEKQW